MLISILSRLQVMQIGAAVMSVAFFPYRLFGGGLLSQVLRFTG
jgi:hypothetical protein